MKLSGPNPQPFLTLPHPGLKPFHPFPHAPTVFHHNPLQEWALSIKRTPGREGTHVCTCVSVCACVCVWVGACDYVCTQTMCSYSGLGLDWTWRQTLCTCVSACGWFMVVSSYFSIKPYENRGWMIKVQAWTFGVISNIWTTYLEGEGTTKETKEQKNTFPDILDKEHKDGNCSHTIKHHMLIGLWWHSTTLQVYL